MSKLADAIKADRRFRYNRIVYSSRSEQEKAYQQDRYAESQEIVDALLDRADYLAGDNRRF